MDLLNKESVFLSGPPWNRGLLLLVAGLLAHLCILGFGVMFIPVSWDEGWNFCVARTLVEKGYYGCLYQGQLTDARLSTGWASVLPAAAGFKLFGIGFVQGRVFIATQAFLAILALWYLARRTFGSKTALTTVLTLLFFSGDQRLHPMMLGAQAWGEMPMILYAILGYIMLARALDAGRSTIFSLTLSSICFGLALSTKVLVQPFLALALFVPAAYAIHRRDYRAGVRFVATLLGAWLIFKLLQHLPLPYHPDPLRTGAGTSGFIQLLGIVLDPGVRMATAEFMLSRCWPYLAGLAYIALLWRKHGAQALAPANNKLETVSLSILVLSASWAFWFLIFSIDFPRYVASALIFGSIFTGHFLVKMTHGLSISETRAAWAALMEMRGNLHRKAAVITAVMLLTFQALLTPYLIYTYLSANGQANEQLIEVADYLNTQTRPDSLIETYDTQLFFLLNRPYHYPPDQFHVAALAQHSGKAMPNEPYTLTDVRPDYIATGIWSREIFHVYDELIDPSTFRLEKTLGQWAVFGRQR